ncbi:hypothetical protein HW555_005361, partial [Spodoptera exigua]
IASCSYSHIHSQLSENITTSTSARKLTSSATFKIYGDSTTPHSTNDMSLLENQYQLFQELERFRVSKPAVPGTSSEDKPETFVSNRQEGSATPQPQRPEKGSYSRLDESLRKQEANFRAFVRTIANINIENMSEKWEFQDALKTLESRWTLIDSLHLEIDSELMGSDLQYETSFCQHEEQFNNLKKEINKRMWSASYREKSTPKLDIPVFNGNYNSWVSFKDLFTDAIHNNSSMPNSQKMQILKTKVKGEAERLIQHLYISSENYASCWEILNHRYNNKKLIFTSHMNILFSLPNIQHNSVSQIKRMHDVTLETLNAVKNLGVDITTWDPILVHLLSQKLDSETYNDYLESLKQPRELPILQELLEFLESRFTNLETSSRRKQDATLQKINYQHSYNNQKAAFTKSNQNNSLLYNGNRTKTTGHWSIAKSCNVTNFTCPMCKHEHGIYKCKSFLQLADDKKLNAVNKLGLCVNCLFSHNGKECNSKHVCRKCSQPHNTILHDALQKSRTSGSSVAIATPPRDSVTSTSHVSQEVVIMSNLIKRLPNKTFSKPSWTNIQNINLADPEFYVSRPVDLLLGADIYSNIILSGIIKGDDASQPMAQQTQLVHGAHTLEQGQQLIHDLNLLLRSGGFILRKWSSNNNQCLWRTGPRWLSTFQPERTLKQTYQTDEEKNLAKQISFSKIVRILAWIQRALTPRRERLPNYLTLQELRKAKNAILTFHGGPRLTLATLRQDYWITGGNNSVKKELRKCVTCRKHEGRTQEQLMGDLPSPVTKLSILPLEKPNETQPTTTITTNQTETATFVRKKQKQNKGSNYISSLIGFLLCLMAIISSGHCFNLTPLNEHQAIYFDKLANMQLVRDEWKIIAYYDLQPYWEGITAYEKYYKHLETICSTLQQLTHCDIIMLQLRHTYTELKHNNKHLMNLEKTSNVLAQQISTTEAMTEFTLSAMAANNLLTHLRNIQDTLLDTITSIHNGRLNIHLIDPIQFQNELSVISGQLSQELTLPIDNIQTNMQSIYNLLRVRAKMTKNYLMFEIIVPLISTENYDLYHIIPVPHRSDEGMFTILPIESYVAVNLQKDAYLPVTENELEHCITRDPTTYLCELKTPIYKMKTDTDLCIKDNIHPEHCKTLVSACQSKWTHLRTIRILCKDQVTAHQLTGINIISLKEQCVVKTDNFTIYSHKHQESTMSLQNKIETLQIAPINHIINISIPRYNLTDENITYPGHEQLLQDIEQRIQVMKNSSALSEISTHDIHHYTLIYLTLGIVAITAAVVVFRRTRCRRQPAAETAPRGAAPATASSSTVEQFSERVQCI